MAAPPAETPRALCLMGPTGAGKTELAVALAARGPFDIISVDSAMVYRGLDIGTAKPDAATLARAPHQLIDLIEPDTAYSAGRFREDALRAMQASARRGRIPLLVGGTGLYFRALTRGLAPLPPRDEALRARIDALREREGAAALHGWLCELDPRSAARIGPADPQRLQRALEVCLATGRPLSALLAEQPGSPAGWQFLKLVLAPGERAGLHARLARRFELMLARGLVEEVCELRRAGRLAEGMPGLKLVGYREVWAYLSGRMDRPSMVAAAEAATRRLARRQLTWLRPEPGAVWLDSDRADTLPATLKYLRDSRMLA